jgi:hypothetical protein
VKTKLSENDPFTKRALQIYEDAKNQLNYPAYRFLQKIRRDGGLAAAKHWLRPTNPTRGFRRLARHSRLDLSVEAVALQTPWNQLFTETELATAHNRLSQFGYRGPFDKISTRSYWVVSPNVRNNEATVDAWRRASVRACAAFMGWYPNNWSRGQIGPTFAGKTKRGIKPGDVILIARRHHFEPEIVGFGIVRGEFVKRIVGLKKPESFGSLRRLQPFIPWSGPPPGDVPLIDVVGHARALAQLDPAKNNAHLKVCEWINQQLQKRSSGVRGGRTAERKKRQKAISPIPKIVSSPENHQLDYKVQNKAKVIKAKRVEAKLLENYRRWLEQQDRKLSAVKYKTLQCDAYEEDRRNLIEAKSSASREHIRMAVGQLLDYAFQGNKKFGDPHKAILLPDEPRTDIVDWLDSLKIKVIWPEKREFLDNANGQFT